MSYQRHLNRLRDGMREWGADLMFLNYGPDMTYIGAPPAPLYYTIMKSPGDWITGVLVSLDRDPVLILQGAFAIEVEAKTWLRDIRVLPDGHDPDAFLAAILREFNADAKTIAVSKMLWGQTLLALQAGAPNARFIPATNSMLDKVRAIKDEDEVRLMQRAAEITDQALAATIANMRIGMTEWDVATEVDYQIKRHGGDGPSFYPGIICVGAGSDPDRHIFTRNTDMVLAAGTTVAFDFGVLYQGYCSDFGRSVFMGDPLPEALAAYHSITTHSQRVWDMMGDGQVSPAQICEWFRAQVAADGFGPWYMTYGLGHAIGLEVHEEPWHRPEYTEPIREGMCFTIEPKVWQPGVFYVRSEDTVVVGRDRATSLTRFHYEPTVIG